MHVSHKMLMEILHNEEDREEQLQRYQRCLQEFDRLEFNDTYVDQIKQDYQILKDIVEAQSASTSEN